MKIDDVVRESKTMTVDFTFTNLADEVYFFEERKPLLAQFIIPNFSLLMQINLGYANKKSSKRALRS